MTTLVGRLYAASRNLLPGVAQDVLELFLTSNSILKSYGWRSSRAARAPIDSRGNPIPWITYSALRFLEPRVRSEFRVFEYGAGNSSLWWAERVREVHSVEHVREWFERIQASAPANLSIVYRTPELYPGAAGEAGGQFDVIVVDGIRRPDCARQCLSSLAPEGVILWDNTDEDSGADGDQEGIAFLETQGLKRLDFWGLGPQLTFGWCTSIFYRPGNCLGI